MIDLFCEFLNRCIGNTVEPLGWLPITVLIGLLILTIGLEYILVDCEDFQENQ